MLDPLLICTDLDRTLLPNGPQSESPHARELFRALVAEPEVKLVYVTGRDKKLVQSAINHYSLPYPDFVICDVGSTIYQLDSENNWHDWAEWQQHIAADWGDKNHNDIKQLLADMSVLRLQERAKQNDYKLSYYVPRQQNLEQLTELINERFKAAAIKANFIWSIDEPAGIGLLDILPASASKRHAIEALMQKHDFTHDNTLFSGDSGNDIDVLTSPIKSILVANAEPEVKDLARVMSQSNNISDRLYFAAGTIHGLNGNYSAGILEGCAHYFPAIGEWLTENNKVALQ